MTTFQDLLGAWGQFSRGDHLSMSLGIIIPGQIYNRGPIDLCVRIVKEEYFRWWWVGGSWISERYLYLSRILLNLSVKNVKYKSIFHSNDHPSSTLAFCEIVVVVVLVGGFRGGGGSLDNKSPSFGTASPTEKFRGEFSSISSHSVSFNGIL